MSKCRGLSSRVTHNFTLGTMGIHVYRERSSPKEQTQQLFQSVGWVSGKYPERLHKGSDGIVHRVQRMGRRPPVGLVRVLDDTEMVAYMHYTCWSIRNIKVMASPGHLVGMVKRYRDYLYIEVMPEESRTPPSTRSTASQSWKTAWPCRSAIGRTPLEASIVTPAILLTPSNDGGIAFGIRQYIGGVGRSV